MDFLLKIILLITLISISVSFIGPFLIWKRMSFLSDAISHSSIFIFALASLFHVNYILITPIFVMLLTFFIVQFDHKYNKGIAITLCSSTFIAIGLIIFSINTSSPINNINNIFIGDILTVNNRTIILVFIFTTFICIFLAKNYDKMLLITINQDIARAEGISIKFYNTIFIVLLTTFIMISVKALGALLLTALLIIPSISARLISNTPYKMSVYTGLICFISSNIGMYTSFLFDTTTGATIVIISSIVFIVIYIIKKLLLNIREI